MSGTLWLVRHGATDWSDAGRLNGWTDVPLNERGRAQAKSLAEPLHGIRFAGVWSSDLRRASETARLAGRGAASDVRLRELNFGTLEGRTWDRCPSDLQESLVAFDGFRAPGGESVVALATRVSRFLEELPDGDHALFTHGGVIRLLLRAAGSDRHMRSGEFAVVTRDAVSSVGFAVASRRPRPDPQYDPGVKRPRGESNTRHQV